MTRVRLASEASLTALTTRVADVEWGPWVAVDVASGRAESTVEVSRSATMVRIRGQLTLLATATSWLTVLTLPAGYRPSKNAFVLSQAGPWIVASSGAIATAGFTGAAGSVHYLSGVWPRA